MDSENKIIHNKIKGLSKQESSRACRYCEIEQAIKKYWGDNPNTWVAKGAIAIPVQMLESWILIGLDPACADDLPIFPEQKKSQAREFYNGAPPEQLKDRCDRLSYAGEIIDKGDFFLNVADTLYLDALTAASSSFARFQQQVASWME